jgi:hypothetical protein
MSRPLRKPHEMKLRLTDGELASLRAMAGDRPLGPAIVAAAIGSRPAAVPSGQSVSAKAGLEAWELRWAADIRRSCPNFPAFKAALDLLRRAM